MIKDPYEAKGKDFRVNHPVQPKTQVERWREEIEENEKVIENCSCDVLPINKQTRGYLFTCEKEGTDNCNHRFLVKIPELKNNIKADHEKNKTYLNRHPVGEFPR